MKVSTFSIRHSEQGEESHAVPISSEPHVILRFAQNDNNI
jgi:hypothetical protein